jgi:hypothetical protein
MDLARAPCRAPLTAREMGSGYENATLRIKYFLRQTIPLKPYTAMKMLNMIQYLPLFAPDIQLYHTSQNKMAAETKSQNYLTIIVQFNA